MGRGESDQPGFIDEKKPDPASSMPDSIELEVYPDEMKLEPLMRAEKLAVDIERFSELSSEMNEIVSRLSREIKISAEQLSRIRLAVNLKKSELKTIVDASAAAIERLNQDYLEQKESLDRLIEAQRVFLEKQEPEREQEELEYLENLRVRREREEEEYRQLWAAEKLKAQQKLKEELNAIQQESLKRQQTMERDCLERELILKRKELEWVQLIQELEQFMTRLTRKSQAQVATRSEPVLKGAPKQNGSREPGLPESEHQIRKDAGFEQEIAHGFFFGDSSGPEVTPDERRGILPDQDPLFGSESQDEPNAVISSLKEILLMQGRRIENMNTELPRKESAPLKFQPKKPTI
jgi:hypothetical protein